MNYCKKCVQPDTRPGIYFDENGICDACLCGQKNTWQLINPLWEQEPIMNSYSVASIMERLKI